jgi:hypothetical protein|tara:strand:- start:6082 stop:6780 length:699 start_codon:yes stop_codon:yes gene_type:complete
MLQIIVHKWGDFYTEKYIDCLRKSIDKHTTVDWNLTVLRDYELGWDVYSEKHFRGEGKPEVVQGPKLVNGYYNYDLGGLPLYKKIYPWVQDEKIGKKNDVFMYLDIDMTINGDLKYFTELNYDKPWVQYDYDINPRLLKKDYKNQNITPINTSVLTWKKGQLKPITDLIKDKPDEVFFTYRRVDAYVWYQFGVKDFFNYFPVDKVDWYYKGTKSLIRNLAGESIELKDDVVV